MNITSAVCSSKPIPPSAHEYFKQIDDATLGLTVVSIILAAATWGLFIMRASAILRYTDKETRRRCLMVISGLFPVISTWSVIGICIPRSLGLANAVIVLYFANVMLTTVFHIVSLFGESQTDMVKALENLGTKIDLRLAPLACCCRCLPKLDVTLRNLTIVRWTVIQTSIVKSVLFFTRLIIYVDTGSSDSAFNVVAGYMNLVSTLLAMYGCQVIVKLSNDALKGYCVRTTFVLVQVGIVIVNVQDAVFEMLAKYDVIPCTPTLSPVLNAMHWNSMLLTLESFVLSLLVGILLRPSKNKCLDLHPAWSDSKQAWQESELQSQKLERESASANTAPGAGKQEETSEVQQNEIEINDRFESINQERSTNDVDNKLRGLPNSAFEDEEAELENLA